MSTILKLQGDPEVMYQAINIENHTFPAPGRIHNDTTKNGICVEITGTMSVGRMKYTVDEILLSTILASKISEVVDSE